MRSEKEILKDVKSLAIEYYELTGKPLGVTGEIAEFEVADILGLELAEVRSPGWDAISTKRTTETENSDQRALETRRKEMGPCFQN